MRQVHWTPLLSPVLALVSSIGWAPRALAQSELPQIIPEMPLDSDVNEVDDVPDSEAGAVDGSATPEKAHKLEADFLSYSAEEVRSRFGYGVSFGIGESMPWQSYSVEADDQLRPDLAVGLYFGGGGFTLKGNSINGRAYDSKMTTHGLGLAARYWVPRIDRLSLEAAFGYYWWNGTITPHGSDDEIADPQEKLTSSFQTSGLAGGLAVNLQWLWDSGFFLQWTPVGIQSAQLLQQDQSRDSDAVKRAVRRDLQRARVYGLIDLKFGYLF